MKQRSVTLPFVVLAGAFALPTLAGCPKDPPPPVVVDAAPPPAVSSAPTDILLLDAGLEGEGDADAEAGAKKPTGNLSVARALQCCNAIAGIAKGLGASPEAGIVNGIAGSCRAAAGQLSPSSTGAELAAIRNMLKSSGKPIPAACN